MERMEKVILSTVCMRLEFLNFHVEGHWMVISHFFGTNLPNLCWSILHVHEMLKTTKGTISSACSKTKHIQNPFLPILYKAPFRLHACARAPWSGTKMEVVQTRQFPELKVFINNCEKVFTIDK